MKKFNITVNGKSYEVDVEEVGGVSTSSPRPVQSTVVPTAVTKASAAAPAHASAAAPAPASATGGETIYAPMPGTIFDIKVAVGDNIKSGDVLVILEAMKKIGRASCRERV